MKKVIAAVLTAMMMANTAAVLPASAAEMGVGNGYQLVDTAYSPEIGYVAISKNLSDQITPGQIFYSETGEKWELVNSPSSITHYANKNTAQNVTWWPKEHMFVLQSDGNVMTSTDGKTWTTKSGVGRANSTITATDEKFVIASRRNIRVFDNLDTQVIDETVMPGTNDYSKAVGVTDTAPYTYAVFDRDVTYLITEKNSSAGATEAVTSVAEAEPRMAAASAEETAAEAVLSAAEVPDAAEVLPVAFAAL